jgi:hypothetical protein
MNVLILNVFNVFQEQSHWNGKLSEGQRPSAAAAATFEDVIELSPRNGVWEAFREEASSLESPRSLCKPYKGLTYNNRGGYTSVPSTTGARVNLVV